VITKKRKYIFLKIGNNSNIKHMPSFLNWPTTATTTTTTATTTQQQQQLLQINDLDNTLVSN
jgi:hypothetical protein